MAAPRSVLVVEDERIIALALCQAIREHGHAVAACLPSAEAALAWLETARPDLVLLDITLEGALDGVQAGAIIRERYHLPLAYITAYSDAATLARAAATKPLALLAKPLAPAELGALMDRLAGEGEC